MKECAVKTNKALGRQLKRHVLAVEHRMAAITAPEFIPLCEQELRGIGLLELAATEAGIEFSAKLTAGYLCNLRLRTAGRIVMRLARFRCGAVEQLFHKVSTFRWELWLHSGLRLHIDVYVRRSRMQHEGLIEKTVLQGIQRRFEELRLVPPALCQALHAQEDCASDAVQRLLVRVVDNACEISLDSSGAHLHQRGYRRVHTGAPLRETLAAAILMKAGWHGDRPLVDGMCGSGTVPIEASLLARRLPPGSGRAFLFEQWPSYQAKTWRYLLRQANDHALAKAPVPIIAIDENPEAIAASRQNADHARVGKDIVWHQRDFFSIRPQELNVEPGLLFLNPPYGKRLPQEDDFYERLGAHLRRFYPGWQAAVMAPDRPRALRLKLARARYWHIKHGGLPIVVVFTRL